MMYFSSPPYPNFCSHQHVIGKFSSKMLSSNFILQSLYSPSNVEYGMSIKVNIIPFLPLCVGKYENELLKSYAEELLRQDNQDLIVHEVVSFEKKKRLKGDFSQYICWKITAECSGNAIYYAAIVRKYLPPIGKTSQLMLVCMGASQASEEAADFFDETVNNINPIVCEYDIDGIEDELRLLRGNEDFYNWCSEKFRLRPFPRLQIEMIRRSIEQYIDINSDGDDASLCFKWKELVQTLVNCLPRDDDEDIEQRINTYISSFLDHGCDGSQRLEWWCEQRSKASMKSRVAFDEVISALLNLKQTKKVFHISKITAIELDQMACSVQLRPILLCRLIQVDYMKAVMSEDALAAFSRFLLRQRSTIYQLAAADCFARLLGDVSEKGISLYDTYIKYTSSILPKHAPIQVQLPTTQSPPTMLADTSSHTKKSGVLGKELDFFYYPETGDISGPLLLTSLSIPKDKWVELVKNKLSLYKVKGDKVNVERLDLFECAKIEQKEGKREITLKFLSGDRVFIAPSKFSFLNWMYFLSRSQYYSGTRPPGYEEPLVDLKVEPPKEAEIDGDIEGEKHLIEQLIPLWSFNSLPGTTQRDVNGIFEKFVHQSQSNPVIVFQRKGWIQLNIAQRILYQLVYLAHMKNVLRIAQDNPDLCSRFSERQIGVCMACQLSSLDMRVVYVTLGILNILASHSLETRSTLAESSVLINVCAFLQHITPRAKRCLPLVEATLPFFLSYLPDQESQDLLFKAKVPQLLESLRRTGLPSGPRTAVEKIINALKRFE
eukprot:TRINITY_DN6534_c0_g1_i3.p1 TRINITY_DN6534_c0_g1~~TRINITY_DN6534_c0_g1_i3.p1  ORF type:complete len:776 (+),score=140.51 TRINITY_DN6534_c0_g1_i3:805-3132(+)